MGSSAKQGGWPKSLLVVELVIAHQFPDSVQDGEFVLLSGSPGNDALEVGVVDVGRQLRNKVGGLRLDHQYVLPLGRWTAGQHLPLHLPLPRRSLGSKEHGTPSEAGVDGIGHGR